MTDKKPIDVKGLANMLTLCDDVRVYYTASDPKRLVLVGAPRDLQRVRRSFADVGHMPASDGTTAAGDMTIQFAPGVHTLPPGSKLTDPLTGHVVTVEHPPVKAAPPHTAQLNTNSPVVLDPSVTTFAAAVAVMRAVPGDFLRVRGPSINEARWVGGLSAWYVNGTRYTIPSGLIYDRAVALLEEKAGLAPGTKYTLRLVNSAFPEERTVPKPASPAPTVYSGRFYAMDLVVTVSVPEGSDPFDAVRKALQSRTSDVYTDVVGIWRDGVGSREKPVWSDNPNANYRVHWDGAASTEQHFTASRIDRHAVIEKAKKVMAENGKFAACLSVAAREPNAAFPQNWTRIN